MQLWMFFVPSGHPGKLTRCRHVVAFQAHLINTLCGLVDGVYFVECSARNVLRFLTNSAFLNAVI